jgi:hypothetical protein
MTRRAEWARAGALVALAALAAAGCARKREPTDADVVKATIQRAVAERCNIVTPSIGIDAKSANGDGSWTYTVRYQCAGLAESGKKHELKLRLAPSKDAAGRLAWNAS